MKLIGKIFNRITLVSLAIAFQMLWLFFVMYKFSEHYLIIAFFFSLISLLAALWIIRRPINPIIKLAWMVPIFIFPIFGGVVYFISGGKEPKKKLRRALEKSGQLTSPYVCQDPEALDAAEREGSHIRNQCRYLADQGFPINGNTDSQYYSDCKEAWLRMLEDLKRAEHFIFLEYFIINPGKMWDPILEILTEKAQAGVDVRVMYDDMGSISYIPRNYPDILKERGIRCISFNRYRPIYSVVMNHRDHRKILVIDGNVAYTGGMNFADEYIGECERFGVWKDNALRLSGAAVRSMTLMFLQMWNAARPTDSAESIEKFMPSKEFCESVETRGLIQPYGDSPVDVNDIAENVYLNIINTATDYLYIASPYVVIDYEMTRAICLAAERGVDVRLLVPAIPDKKIVFELTQSYFPELYASGVKIYKFTPGFVHSKCFVADDNIAVVGTINIDYRSLMLHFENACLYVGHPVIADVRKDFEETFPQCEEVVPKERRFDMLYELYLSILKLFAPLF